MERVISNSATLTYGEDGKTYYAVIVPETGSRGFYQYYDKATGKCTPDWTDDSKGPKFHVHIYDTDGVSYQPASRPHLIWNEKEVAIDSKTDFDGYYYGDITAVQETTGDKNWVFQIVKNLFGSGNPDSDYFYLRCPIIDSSGNSIDVYTDTQRVECSQMATGNYVKITITGGNIQKGNDSTVLTVTVDKSGTLADAKGGKWYIDNPGATADTLIVSGQGGFTLSADNSQLTVNKDAVNGSLLIKYVYEESGISYAGYRDVADMNDPYYVELLTSSLSTPGKLQKGEKVTYRGHVIKGDGTEISGYTMLYYTTDANNTKVLDGVEGYAPDTTDDSGKKIFTYTKGVVAIDRPTLRDTYKKLLHIYCVAKKTASNS